MGPDLNRNSRSTKKGVLVTQPRHSVEEVTGLKWGYRARKCYEGTGEAGRYVRGCCCVLLHGARVIYRRESDKTWKFFYSPPLQKKKLRPQPSWSTIPHLWTCTLPRSSISAAAPRPEVEVTIHDGVHAGVSAGEEEESFLNPLIHRLRRSLVYPIPATFIETHITRVSYPVAYVRYPFESRPWIRTTVSVKQQHGRLFYPGLQYNSNSGHEIESKENTCNAFFKCRPQRLFAMWHQAVVRMNVVMHVSLFTQFYFSFLPIPVAARAKACV